MEFDIIFKIVGFIVTKRLDYNRKNYNINLGEGRVPNFLADKGKSYYGSM